jgi:hypothetical protein
VIFAVICLFGRGLRLRPGTATSSDGLSFEDREGPILELGEKGTWDQNGVSWPRVLPPQGKPESIFTLHTLPFVKFAHILSLLGSMAIDASTCGNCICKRAINFASRFSYVFYSRRVYCNSWKYCTHLWQ